MFMDGCERLKIVQAQEDTEAEVANEQSSIH